MGSDHSKYDRTIRPQNPLIIAIDSRFVMSHQVTLVMNSKFWTGDFHVKDSKTEAIYFKTNQTTSFGFSRKKMLLDHYDKPIANFKHRSHAYDVYRGQSSDDHAFRIEEEYSYTRYKLSAAIDNQATGQRLVLYVRGDSESVYIFNGHPKQGGQAIASVSRNGFFESTGYTLCVASGVDLAMVVFLVMAFHEARESNHRQIMDD